jgi:hypothetical protein
MTSKVIPSATAVTSESHRNLRERRASLFAKLQEPDTQQEFWESQAPSQTPVR